MNIRLYNAKILTMKDDRVFNGEVWVKDHLIYKVLSEDELKSEGLYQKERIVWDKEYDCKSNLLMPGFKNAHTHSAMTFLRSYADDVPLQQWLYEKIFPMEAKINADDIYAFTKLAILEYLTSGITSIFDMYIVPDATALACRDMGMRCVLVSGLNNFTSSMEQMEEEFLKYKEYHPLISYQLGFHAEYTCEKELLRKVADMSQQYGTPVYCHLNETLKEVKECKDKYGMTPAAFLDSLGMFEYGGGGYHCVHMSSEDIQVFKKKKLFAITNPSSNLKLASGIAPLDQYQKENIDIAIGTDGAASNNCLDMFREMFLVSGLSKIAARDAAAMDAFLVLKMATSQGARAMCLNNADVLEENKLADMILINLNSPNMQPIHNIPKNIVYSGSKQNVIMTMIHGKVLYDKGEFFVGEGVEDIYDRCNRILSRIMD